jgi:gas vesicle protein
MSTGSTDRKLFIGILVGVSVGLASVLLFSTKRGSRLRTSLVERAKDAADQVRSLGRDPDAWRDRKRERVGRTLLDQLERIRSAGL